MNRADERWWVIWRDNYKLRVMTCPIHLPPSVRGILAAAWYKYDLCCQARKCTPATFGNAFALNWPASLPLLTLMGGVKLISSVMSSFHHNELQDRSLGSSNFLFSLCQGPSVTIVAPNQYTMIRTTQRNNSTEVLALNVWFFNSEIFWEYLRIFDH